MAFKFANDQSLYLSDIAYKTLKNDNDFFLINDFSKDISKEIKNGNNKSFAGFLSSIIINYAEEFSKKLLDQVQNITVNKYKMDLKKIDKKHKTKIRFKNEAVTFLERKIFDICDQSEMQVYSDIYKDSLSSYINDLLETYSKEPYSTREKIYFKQTIEVLNEALDNNKSNKSKKSLIQLTYGNDKYLVYPHSIISDTWSSYNHFIGKAKLISSDDAEWKVRHFKISLIKNPVCKYISNIDVQDINISEIDGCLKENDVQFIEGKPIKIRVKFTPKGLELYNSIFHLRPHMEEFNKDTLEGIFSCTEFQAMFYFERLGQEAVILEPEKLKDKITEYYKNALEKYQKYY